MTDKNREFECIVVSDIIDTPTFHGRPARGHREIYEVAMVDAQGLQSQLTGKPVHFEHRTDKEALGVVTASKIVNVNGKNQLRAEFTLNTTSSPAALVTAAMVDVGFTPCVSLSHRRRPLEPIELTICKEGAREGAVIVRGHKTLNRINLSSDLQDAVSKVDTSISRSKIVNASSSRDDNLVVATKGYLDPDLEATTEDGTDKKFAPVMASAGVATETGMATLSSAPIQQQQQKHLETTNVNLANAGAVPTQYQSVVPLSSPPTGQVSVQPIMSQQQQQSMGPPPPRQPPTHYDPSEHVEAASSYLRIKNTAKNANTAPGAESIAQLNRFIETSATGELSDKVSQLGNEENHSVEQRLAANHDNRRPSMDYEAAMQDMRLQMQQMAAQLTKLQSLPSAPPPPPQQSPTPPPSTQHTPTIQQQPQGRSSSAVFDANASNLDLGPINSGRTVMPQQSAQPQYQQQQQQQQQLSQWQPQQQQQFSYTPLSSQAPPPSLQRTTGGGGGGATDDYMRRLAETRRGQQQPLSSLTSLPGRPTPEQFEQAKFIVDTYNSSLDERGRQQFVADSAHFGNAIANAAVHASMPQSNYHYGYPEQQQWYPNHNNSYQRPYQPQPQPPPPPSQRQQLYNTAAQAVSGLWEERSHYSGNPTTTSSSSMTPVPPASTSSTFRSTPSIREVAENLTGGVPPTSVNRFQSWQQQQQQQQLLPSPFQSQSSSSSSPLMSSIPPSSVPQEVKASRLRPNHYEEGDENSIVVIPTPRAGMVFFKEGLDDGKEVVRASAHHFKGTQFPATPNDGSTAWPHTAYLPGEGMTARGVWIGRLGVCPRSLLDSTPLADMNPEQGYFATPKPDEQIGIPHTSQTVEASLESHRYHAYNALRHVPKLSRGPRPTDRPFVQQDDSEVIGSSIAIREAGIRGAFNKIDSVRIVIPPKACFPPGGEGTIDLLALVGTESNSIEGAVPDLLNSTLAEGPVEASVARRKWRKERMPDLVATKDWSSTERPDMRSMTEYLMRTSAREDYIRGYYR